MKPFRLPSFPSLMLTSPSELSEAPWQMERACWRASSQVSKSNRPSLSLRSRWLLEEIAKTWRDTAALAAVGEGSRTMSPDFVTPRRVAAKVIDRGTEADIMASKPACKRAGRMVRYWIG